MNAYIIKGYRSAVGKSHRGMFRFIRPDELSAQVIKHLIKNTPELNEEMIDDLIVGNATPEAEQGLNIARIISLMGLKTDKVPGMTINRFCSSGIESISIACSKIISGVADCVIAGGVESMSPIPFGGWRIVPNTDISKSNPSWYWSMGNTAEEVARKYNISREDQDLFALNSHVKAIKAIDNGSFLDQIVPIEINESYLDSNEKMKNRSYLVRTDEGPRRDTNIDVLSKLKPVFAANGTVTAGNSSQTSDGAAFLLIVSEKMLKKLKIKPIARLLSYHVSGLDPKIMGMGPVYAVPNALKKANLKLNQIELIELNEAFASQSIAVIRELGLNPDLVNPNGGAISLGHPLGCTGAKLSIQLFDEMRKRKLRYGMVTMCVGTGQGAAGIYELLN